jgi:hypothetical protein
MNSAQLLRIFGTGFLLTLLMACTAESDLRERPEAFWPERSTVFLADAQAGVVRALNVKSGIVPLGEIITPARASVLALSLDTQAKQLWVLDGGALHAYDAVTFHLLRRWTAPYGITLKMIKRDAEGAVLAVDTDGRRYLPDPTSLALKPAFNGRRFAVSHREALGANG